MSHYREIGKVLSLLENGETKVASDLFHEVVVDKARKIYEEIVDENYGIDEEELGGDVKDDFVDDVSMDDDASEAGVDGIDAEATGDEEASIEDLETALAQLRAEFDALVSDELETEPHHAGLGAELDDIDVAGDEAGYEDGVMEATKLQDEQSADLGSEGKLTGTGNKSKAGSVDKKSMYTDAPSQRLDTGADVTKFGGGDEKGETAPQGNKVAVEDNIDAPQNQQSADLGSEGKLAGTGNKSKTGSVDKKSMFTDVPK